ncbi:MAG TPA: 4Fe-4S dicluster domain-containing protein, partial [Polyangia bacterium]|nr:4Fe-4S dicluster domain-containing protein [Polyangia bacterium]
WSGTALAASGCAIEVPRQIVPYTRRPPEVVPGVPTYYATSMPLDGYASGLLVESREGRPTKIEANPAHPATLGGTSLFQQASILQLYDDWRGRRVRRGADPSSWEDLFAALRAPRDDGGARLRIVMEPTASPLLLDLLGRVRRRFPAARMAFQSALPIDGGVEAARLAFGRPLLPQLDLARADVILALDCDFLEALPFSVRYARQWARRRRLASAQDRTTRLYVAESLLGVTGSMADHRLRRPLSRIPEVALAVAAELRLPGQLAALARRARPEPEVAAWAKGVAADLRGRPPGSTLVLVGDRQPAAVQALGQAMNAALGNVGGALTFTEPVLPRPGAGGLESFDELVEEMRAGRVDTLLIAGVNPVYTAPADLDFAGALARVPESVYLGAYENETAERCRWFAPEAHYLESWGDARAYDGTISMLQPLIHPLVDARTAGELLAVLAGEGPPDAYRLLHGFWTGVRALPDLGWQEAIRLGLQPGTAFAPVATGAVDVAAVGKALEPIADAAAAPPSAIPGALEIELYPSPTVHDGRFANNAWLQEHPAPLEKLTWDNAVLVSPATAKALGLENERLVDLSTPSASVRAPVLVAPGLADGVAALWLGYGRRGQEAVAAGVGANAYPLRTRAHLHAIPGARLHPRAERHPLALTQEHFYTHDRPIALRRTLDEYRRDPEFTAQYRSPAYSMVPEYQYRGDQWAMSIDLGICTGCGACALACQSENNIPVVGPDQVRNSREMNWLRIDTYFSGPPEAPRPMHQPMMCQHCEKAPCEYVCPVGATTHSPDGLNEMVYNRCVGTRFCSNNCPYKVRRFNWFDWGDRVRVNRGLVQLQYNPDVTVRERGVMEKCSYCVQRIRGAQITAELEGRAIRPGEVVTACQGACPTGAIQFGSLAHRNTEMVRWRQQDRSYAVLQQEEGTEPRTIYLARIDNPNRELA